MHLFLLQDPMSNGRINSFRVHRRLKVNLIESYTSTSELLSFTTNNSWSRISSPFIHFLPCSAVLIFIVCTNLGFDLYFSGSSSKSGNKQGLSHYSIPTCRAFLYRNRCRY